MAISDQKSQTSPDVVSVAPMPKEEESPKETKEEIEIIVEEPAEEIRSTRKLSNRCKAILHMNMYCLLAVIYQMIAKQATMNMGIHVMDLVFIRVSMNFIASNFTVRISGK